MDAIISAGWDLNEHVEIGAAAAIPVDGRADGYRSFLRRMACSAAITAFGARIDGAGRNRRSGGLMHDLTHQLRRDRGGRRHRLIGWRRYLHRLVPGGGLMGGHPQFFYCDIAPVNKNLRFPCLVRGTQ